MKKVLLSTIIVICTLMLTGCQEEVNLDLEAITVELDNLKTGELDIQSIDIFSMGVYGELSYIYDFDFSLKLGLDSSLVSEYNVQYNEDTKELLAIFKPISDKEAIKTAINNLELENLLVEEYQGYLIFIASSDNTKVLESVKNSEALVFNAMMNVDSEQMETLLGLTSEDVEEFTMKVPTFVVSSSTYIIVKPAEGKEDLVKEKLDLYMTNLETQWSTYLPEQYELVKNRKEEQLGEYLIYIVSYNNDLVFDAIKN